MTYVQGRADDPILDWSPELLKAIHHRVLAGRRGAGRYGEGRFLVNEVTNELIYTPPQEGVEQLILDACRRMKESEAHPALRAAWVPRRDRCHPPVQGRQRPGGADTGTPTTVARSPVRTTARSPTSVIRLPPRTSTPFAWLACLSRAVARVGARTRLALACSVGSRRSLVSSRPSRPIDRPSYGRSPRGLGGKDHSRRRHARRAHGDTLRSLTTPRAGRAREGSRATAKRAGPRPRRRPRARGSRAARLRPARR